MGKSPKITLLTGNIVLGIALYLPLEPVLLKALPERYLSVVYLLPEVAIWLAFSIVILHRILASGTWRRTALDKPLQLFAIAAGLTIIVNRAFSFDGLENVNALLKYVPVYFVAAHVLRDGFTHLPVRLTKIILGLAVLEMGVGGLQIARVPGLNDLLQPAAVQIGEIRRVSQVIAGSREIGAVYGTLGDTVHYGWFLTIALIVTVARIRVTAPSKRWFYGALAGVLIVFIGLSYARVLILSAVFVLFWAFLLWIRQVSTRRVVLVSSGLLILVGLVFAVGLMRNREFRTSLHAQQSFIQDVLSVLTVRYRQIAYRYGRLGWMAEAPPTVLLNHPLLGFGPDQHQAYDDLYAAKPNFLTFVRPISTMEDVYWVALLIYYGVLGVVAWGWILFRHYRLGKSVQRFALSPVQQHTVWIALLYIPVMGLAQFANQAFEFRIAGYYFWVFLGLLQGVYWQNGRTPQ